MPKALLIIHAHIDHTGALPLIASLFSHIPIYATESTRVLTEILLRDSVNIMEQDFLSPHSGGEFLQAARSPVNVRRQKPFCPLFSASSGGVRSR